MGDTFSTFGKYPKEYNARIHGPYDPARFYGKPDTPFGEVKVAELPGWLQRRNMSIRGLSGLMGRAYNRWLRTGVHAKKPSGAPLYQVLLFMGVWAYILKARRYRMEKHAKYH